MFGLGGLEIMIILVVALLVLGPQKLPEIARTLGKGMREVRRTAAEFTRELNYPDLEIPTKKKLMKALLEPAEEAVKAASADIEEDGGKPAPKPRDPYRDIAEAEERAEAASADEPPVAPETLHADPPAPADAETTPGGSWRDTIHSELPEGVVAHDTAPPAADVAGPQTESVEELPTESEHG